MENLHLLNLKRQINELSLNERDELLKILNKPVVMDSQFEAYAAFCIECDRQGLKPIKYKDYLEIG